MDRSTLKNLASLVCFTLGLLCSCGREEYGKDPAAEGRESILDRKVHIEPRLITEIPSVPRWCERLKLKKSRVNVGDAELYVEEEGRGMPLVLINGGPGGTHHYFHPWFSRVKKYARVIYYDQRGCGLSDFKPGQKGYSVFQAIDDLEGLRQALGVEKWVLLGYSYGGFLAQFYAVNHPEHTAGLILLGSSPGMRVDTGRSRQMDFVSKEEKARLDEIRRELQKLAAERKLSRREYMKILLYNNFLNGDWKRQHFYKPTPERLAQIALYEWDHDDNFNNVMNRSMSQIDLTGLFAKNPIPTLILEGKWDLTWGEQKTEILKRNHPHARIVIFENASHGIYDEVPALFFSVLESFIRNLPELSPDQIAAFKETLPDWEKERVTAETAILSKFGWGIYSSLKLAERYTMDWISGIKDTMSVLRIGFALYDVENYKEALHVFGLLEELAIESGDTPWRGLALIWQGHMLDLLGRRREAVERYRQAAGLNIEQSWMHGQYDLKYSLSPYARERMKAPFQRIGNRFPD